jgi:hypothetical protein
MGERKKKSVNTEAIELIKFSVAGTIGQFPQYLDDFKSKAMQTPQDHLIVFFSKRPQNKN